MKNSMLLAAGLLLASSLTAQINTHAVFTSGGSYGTPDNHVKLHRWDGDDAQAMPLDSALGDFSNFVATRGHQALYHVGRGWGHPEGEDLAILFDMSTHTVLDTIPSIGGASDVYWSDHGLVVSKGFGGSGSRLLFYDNDLELIHEDTLIQSSIGALEGIDEYVFVAFDQNDTAMIYAYDMLDLSTPIMMIGLDTLAAGIHDLLYVDGGLLAMGTRYDAQFNVMYESFTQVSLDGSMSYTVDTSLVEQGSGFFGQAENRLYMDVSSTGVDTISFSQGVFGQYLSINPSAGAVDTSNAELFLLETDYWSYSNIHWIGAMNSDARLASAPISATAIHLFYNQAIEAINDNYSGERLIFDEDLIDPDGAMAVDTAWTVPSFIVDRTDTSIIMPFAVGVFDLYLVDVFGDTSRIALEGPSSISPMQEGERQLVVFPNPSQDQIYLPTASNETYKLYTLDGRVVRQGRVEGQGIRWNDTAPGLYILEVQSLGVAKITIR